MSTKAILALADGSLFKGISIGADGISSGEVVFNTAMTGYQEILTDPSYAQQIVTLTYPHIGNYGTNSEDVESNAVHASGLIIRDLPLLASSFRSEQALDEYLKANDVKGIANIDTRALTRLLRDKGSLGGCILTGEDAYSEENQAKALEQAKSFPGLKGMDLAKEVTIDSSYKWTRTEWALGEGFTDIKADEIKYKVVAYDFGVKQNILRILAQRGCDLTVVPAQTSAQEVLKMNPDGVFLANGPGDPEPCDYAISAIKTLLDNNVPLFGICLGHQLLALAGGAKTVKMKNGHHGANHPVEDISSKRVMITSQNHGFAVDEQSLPANIQATHRSLFDGTLQGIKYTDKPAFGFQGHPEASPGSQDAAPLFDHFIDLMNAKVQPKS